MSTNTVSTLIEALSPFVLANSSEEHIMLTVRTADITRARAAIAAAEAAQAEVAAPAAIPDDAITVNLVRLAGLDKHKARECEQIVRQVLAQVSAAPAQAAEPVYVSQHAFDWLASRKDHKRAAIHTALMTKPSDDQCVPLYTHPAPRQADDALLTDALRYRALRTGKAYQVECG